MIFYFKKKYKEKNEFISFSVNFIIDKIHSTFMAFCCYFLLTKYYYPFYLYLYLFYSLSGSFAFFVFVSYFLDIAKDKRDGKEKIIFLNKILLLGFEEKVVNV